jgi:N-acetylglucosaminyl-diphospho-decaprenol L-rhamnosyltransferase
VTPALSIVVVAHDSEADLARLLASLARHVAAASQLLVVDTGSRDGSAARARAAGAELIKLEGNPGFGAANNAGVERAEAPVTALLNPDIALEHADLERLVARAARCRALFVPRLVGADGAVQKTAHPPPGRLEALGFALLGPALPPPLRLRAEPWRSARARPVGWAIAAALVARTDILRALGPFDPAAFLFYEDLDLCLRAAARGIPTVLDPGVVLRHRGGHSTGPAYEGEPYALLARRRREVVGARLGARALARDDLAQGVTFATRAAARRLVGRPATRPLAQLAALRAVRRAGARRTLGQ